MKKRLDAESRALVQLVSLVLLLTVCVPTWAWEPPSSEEVKSSRKPKASASTSTSTAPRSSVKPTGQPNDKADTKVAQPNELRNQIELGPATSVMVSEPVMVFERLELDASGSSDSTAEGTIKLAASDDVIADKKSTSQSSSKTDDQSSIELQQRRDEGECPGGESSKVAASQNLNDIPLDQEEHPFDAPSAQTEEITHDGLKAKLIKATPVADSSSRAKPVGAAGQLEDRINKCLAYYYTHPENLTKRSPWAVMHTILPFGVETEVLAGNRQVNAVGWMCYNGVCKSQRMFQPTKSGFRTNVGPGVQGHEGQFLAILAQSSVPRNFPIMVGQTRYTVNDLIRYEMATCREKSELTFKLIGLSHYLSPNQTWRDDRGHTWNLEKLVREELDQPVVGAACGGTHRLMGLSYALMMRKRYDLPINGHWARAEIYLQDFVQYAFSLQNPDGSFSTDWFEGRANKPDMERKVQTTGHILEWLVFTLPADQLEDARIVKSLEFLLSQVYDQRDKDWPIGPRGHSLRAISLYNQRVFGVPTGQLKNHMADAGLLKHWR